MRRPISTKDLTHRFREFLNRSPNRIADAAASNITTRLGCLALAMLVTTPVFADGPSLLKIFKRDRNAKPIANARALKQEDGPFMILAATLVGKGSKERAEKLADELSDELRRPAFIYEDDFDFTGKISYDPQTSRATRYANPYKYQAFAVLVGEYDSVTHPDISKDLDRIKRFQPKVYQDPNEVAAETDRSNPVTTIKNITTKLQNAARKQGKNFGPLSRAHVTRNPKLTAEYFSQPEVDSFVRKLNKDVPYSLLENPSRFTVVVKTFRGTERIVDKNRSADSIQPDGDHLALMMDTANKMVAKLRKNGVEAYQYHDRHQSLVTIGSFESLGTELPGGRFQYAAGIRKIIKEYSALNVHPDQASQVDPYRRRLRYGSNAVAANAVNLVPFDIQPKPIAVPKVSKRSLYRALGQR